MDFVYQGITPGSILAFVLFLVVFLGINELTRRSLKLSILVYGILPLLLVALVFSGILGSPTGKTWFGWVKVISALIGVYGFLAIRFTNLKNKKFASIFPVSILALNIAEAVYRELQVYSTYKTLQVDAGGILIQGGAWNLFNAAAGVLCIVTLTGFMGIRVSNDKSKDMIWPDMTWMYIVGYTLWNFAYVYNCISTRSMYAGFGILLAAMIAEWVFKKGAWLQHRAQILSLYAMFSLSVDFQKSDYFKILPTYNQSFLMGLSILSFVFNAAFFGFMVYTILSDRKNPLKQEIFENTRYYQQSIKENNI